MNEILKAMEERRSVRKFKPDMPRREDLEAIIEAGLYAASAMGKQSAIAVAVTNRELRDRISDDNRKIGGWGEGFDPFYGAPAILIVLAPKNWPNRVYDGSLRMGNMMLAAHSLGLGSIWIHGPGRSLRRTPAGSSWRTWESRASGKASATAPWAMWTASCPRPRSAERTECSGWSRRFF